MYKTKELFDLSHTVARDFLAELDMAHLALPRLGEIIEKIGASLSPREYERHGKCIYISRRARVERDAQIGEGVIICEGAEIRKGAFIRGNVIIGESAVIGNSCEIKNSIIFDECQIPHFNYVGDSILGYRAHLGAGVICSNLRSDKANVRLNADGEIIDTGLRKLGAMVGDFAEIGCNSVLCPGAIVGRGASVYPLALVRGQIKENSIFKGAGGL